MLKLHILESTELSAYCLCSLEKHGITLVREFIAEKTDKLVKILNINVEQVKIIKEEFLRIYGPKHYIGHQYARAEELKEKVYGTQIESLDNMLAPRELFSNLSFWEICGPTAVGKTQLAFTLLLNFVMNQVAAALFVDTKLDFSASRIKSMLEAREVEPSLYAGIMSFIKVERVLSAQGVVEMLERLCKGLEKKTEDVDLIKMVVIDSLPSVWFLMKSDCNRLSGKWLLSRLSQIINRLVRQHNIAVVCINLSLTPSPDENGTKVAAPSTSNNDDNVSDLIDADDNELDSVNSPSLASGYRPVLGNFWLSKPYTRLSLEFPDKGNVKYSEDPSLRVIRSINTRYLPSGIYCSVKLRPEGFI